MLQADALKNEHIIIGGTINIETGTEGRTVVIKLPL